jgi:hypothetical protein
MKITKRTLMGWGAIALAVSLLILAAPKAAHAIVATLVQVANTSANPAITQDVSKLASQNVQIYCNAAFPATVACTQILPDGSSTGAPYVVPTGQRLIITTVQLMAFGADNPELFVGQGETARGVWILTAAGSFQFQYPSGIVFASERTLLFTGGAHSGPAYFNGYLVSN